MPKTPHSSRGFESSHKSLPSLLPAPYDVMASLICRTRTIDSRVCVVVYIQIIRAVSDLNGAGSLVLHSVFNWRIMCSCC